LDDITLTQLFARMDAHLERQDAQLERVQIQHQLTQKHLDQQDRVLREDSARTQVMIEALQKQGAMLVELTHTLTAGQAYLAEMVVESQRIGREVAAMTAEVLRRTPG
jgi:chemotaxis receptor (MCP) glutamine deamidase CheD